MKKNLAIIQKWNNLEHGSWFSDTEYLFENFPMCVRLNSVIWPKQFKVSPKSLAKALI